MVQWIIYVRVYKNTLKDGGWKKVSKKDLVAERKTVFDARNQKEIREFVYSNYAEPGKLVNISAERSYDPRATMDGDIRMVILPDGTFLNASSRETAPDRYTAFYRRIDPRTFAVSRMLYDDPFRGFFKGVPVERDASGKKKVAKNIAPVRRY